jgi:hypothetical protein
MVLMVTLRANDSPDRRAIGIAPRRGDIIGRRLEHPVDRNIDRALELDHEDGAGRGHLGLDIVGELENQPGIAACHRQRGSPLDRLRLADAR